MSKEKDNTHTETMYSLTETADLHGISKGYLSRCLKEGKEAKGYDLRPYAAYDADGHVKHFAFPDGYEFPAGSKDASDNSVEEDSHKDASHKLVPMDSSSKTAQTTPTDTTTVEPLTVQIYKRDDWLSHREAIKLMAQYLPIDYEYEATTHSNISEALDTIAKEFKKGGGNGGSRREKYYLKGKVLAVIRQIQQEGLQDAIWIMESEEWQDHIHEALGLSRENGIDVDPYSSPSSW